MKKTIIIIAWIFAIVSLILIAINPEYTNPLVLVLLGECVCLWYYTVLKDEL